MIGEAIRAAAAEAATTSSEGFQGRTFGAPGPMTHTAGNEDGREQTLCKLQKRCKQG
jgi:hypothetical protein